MNKNGDLCDMRADQGFYRSLKMHFLPRLFLAVLFIMTQKVTTEPPSKLDLTNVTGCNDHIGVARIGNSQTADPAPRMINAAFRAAAS